MLLAGVGNADARHKRNFFLVDDSTRALPVHRGLWVLETQPQAVEEAFDDLTGRRDVAILLINQHIADQIRERVAAYKQIMPALLEIPSKDNPYDPEKDTVLQRVNQMYAAD